MSKQQLSVQHFAQRSSTSRTTYLASYLSKAELRRPSCFTLQHQNYSTARLTSSPLACRIAPTILPRPAISACRARAFTYIRSMSSDADYMSFLDKANQDTGSAQTQSTSHKGSYGTKSVDTEVPQALQSVEEYYVSDADEPFEPVSLKFSGKQISASDLKKLLGGEKDVEDVQMKTFEGQYRKVVDAVKKAGSGEVKVFKVSLDGTRSEYYVVAVDEEQGRVVGLKALAVES